jgi:Aspartyl protease
VAVEEIPFGRLAHLVTLPVALNGVEGAFVLDSGIGLTIVRAPTQCESTGETFTGRRMSGQAVTVPLATASSIAVGTTRVRDVPVGVLDMSGFPPELDHIGGFLSLASFEGHVLTVDYPRGVVRLGGRVEGAVVPVTVERDGPSVTFFMPLTIPGGRSVSVEVDMGSDSLILDERFAAEVGVDLNGAGLRRVDGIDETGHAYRRTFTELTGAVWPTAAPHLSQDAPAVMFQRIIHDGLVGDAFLRRFAVTFDVAGERFALAA